MSGRESAQKTVIALHGAGMNANAWNLLAKELPCTALSLPGHGMTTGPLLPSVKGMADWVRAQLEDYPPQSVVLLGHSMGALVALEAARSAAVCALVLMGAAAAMPVHPDLLKQAAEAPPAAADLILKWGVSRNSPETVEMLKKQMQPETLANDLLACNDYVAGEAASKACCKPALVISGSDDKMAKAAAAQALAEMMPKGRFCSIDGYGHMLMVEDPVKTAREIKGFVAGLED